MPVLCLSAKPLISLSADTNGLTGDLLGKSVGDLQSNVAISGDVVTGTLKYVTGYTGFSGATAEQSGNYLALHFSSTDAGAVITCQMFNGDHPDRVVTLDEDGIIICRVPNNDCVLKVTATVEGTGSTIKTYSFSGLTLTPAT